MSDQRLTELEIRYAHLEDFVQKRNCSPPLLGGESPYDKILQETLHFFRTLQRLHQSGAIQLIHINGCF